MKLTIITLTAAFCLTALAACGVDGEPTAPPPRASLQN